VDILGLESKRAVPLMLPVFDEEMEVAALNAFHNERFVLGEDVFKFEEEFASYIGVKHAVSTSSGTSALQIALLALGISGGNEVVTSAFSFVASANAVLHAGGTPVFADVAADDLNVDPKKVGAKFSNRVWGLLPVHLFGYPSKMRELMDFANDNDLRVVEDACQAHGAEYAGRRVGAIGDVGCFSFYPSKNMTVCGDGGMITTDNGDVAKLAAKIRDCGRKTKYEHDVVGYTSRLNTVNAAIGRVQLRRLDEWNRKRVRNASVYSRLLSGVDEVKTPLLGDEVVKPVFHLYVIRAERRDKLAEWLLSCGVQVAVHYPLPIPLQPVYRQLFGYEAGEFCESEQASKSCLSLPVNPGLVDEDIEYVCDKIVQFYSRGS
jgi:perosamine synthetase